MQKVAKLAEADYTLFYTKYNNLMLGYFALDRFVRLAGDTGAGLLYADSYSVADGNQVCTPVIDYQFGSLRDDFNFGSVIFFDTAKFK
jgi:hypothetical protein